MARRIARLPAVPTRPLATENSPGFPGEKYETLALTIQVVTPMFGGGAVAGVPDPVTPVRASSIRGQLRFWWRATRGAVIADVEQLKQRETEIFGDTEHPSPLTVRVECKSTPAKRCAAYEWNPNASQGKGGYSLRWDKSLENRAVSYALFPFQGKPPEEKRKPNQQPEELPALMTEPFVFELRLTIPKELAADIRAALWGWINFGGLGARTRRGCGTVMCPDFSPRSSQPNDLQRWWDDSGKHLDESGITAVFPTAFERLVIVESAKKPIEAWSQAVQTLRDFRQGAGIGRNGSQGRSFWPEPETIRRLTGQRLPKHSREEHMPDHGFPRAEFGLPIVFHFKDGAKTLRASGVDPVDTELYPVVEGVRRSRMASPLIIKALAAADGKAIPLIAELRTPGLDHVELVHDRDPVGDSGQCAIRGAKFADCSAIDAFLEFATQKRSFKSLIEEVRS